MGPGASDVRGLWLDSGELPGEAGLAVTVAFLASSLLLVADPLPFLGDRSILMAKSLHTSMIFLLFFVFNWPPTASSINDKVSSSSLRGTGCLKIASGSWWSA